MKCIILPRQAQDKHRENSKKNGVFSQALRKSTGDSDLPYMTSEQFAEVDADGSGAASERTEDEQEGKKAAHVLARTQNGGLSLPRRASGQSVKVSSPPLTIAIFS
jgi:hypothetical protein